MIVRPFLGFLLLLLNSCHSALAPRCGVAPLTTVRIPARTWDGESHRPIATRAFYFFRFHGTAGERCRTCHCGCCLVQLPEGPLLHNVLDLNSILHSAAFPHSAVGRSSQAVISRLLDFTVRSVFMFVRAFRAPTTTMPRDFKCLKGSQCSKVSWY